MELQKFSVYEYDDYRESTKLSSYSRRTLPSSLLSEDFLPSAFHRLVFLFLRSLLLVIHMCFNGRGKRFINRFMRGLKPDANMEISSHLVLSTVCALPASVQNAPSRVSPDEVAASIATVQTAVLFNDTTHDPGHSLAPPFKSIDIVRDLSSISLPQTKSNDKSDLNTVAIDEIRLFHEEIERITDVQGSTMQYLYGPASSKPGSGFPSGAPGDIEVAD
ncbi:hypothetical protein DL96DRAFT_1685382 [Flagelloscypha sp. PMI_526]|nr:hypothetical protein DL96DRAFT_1685382 [Flagelloscypha sp. PMI_526]